MISDALSIVTDPAHLTAEAIFRAGELVLEVTVMAWWVRRHDRRNH